MNWSFIRDELWELFDSNSIQQFKPKIEIKNTDKAYQVSVEVPGMSEKDLNVILKDNVLVIEGVKKNETQNENKKNGVFHSEFNYGSFYRAIPLGDDANPDEVSANYQDGILTIDVSKRPDNSSPEKRIEIKSTKH